MDNFNKVEIAMSMRGKKLLFIIGAPDNRVDFIYTGRFKMTRKWKETFDPLAELQKIVRHVYVEGSDDHGSNIPGLLIRGEEDLPDLWGVGLFFAGPRRNLRRWRTFRVGRG